MTRGGLRHSAAVAGGARVGGGASLGLFGGAATAAATASVGDVAILNFALTLEYLEKAFYSAANRDHHLKGRMLTFTELADATRRSIGSSW